MATQPICHGVSFFRLHTRGTVEFERNRVDRIFSEFERTPHYRACAALARNGAPITEAQSEIVFLASVREQAPTSIEAVDALFDRVVARVVREGASPVARNTPSPATPPLTPVPARATPGAGPGPGPGTPQSLSSGEGSPPASEPTRSPSTPTTPRTSPASTPSTPSSESNEGAEPLYIRRLLSQRNAIVYDLHVACDKRVHALLLARKERHLCDPLPARVRKMGPRELIHRSAERQLRTIALVAHEKIADAARTAQRSTPARDADMLMLRTIHPHLDIPLSQHLGWTDVEAFRQHRSALHAANNELQTHEQALESAKSQVQKLWDAVLVNRCKELMDALNAARQEVEKCEEALKALKRRLPFSPKDIRQGLDRIAQANRFSSIEIQQARQRAFDDFCDSPSAAALAARTQPPSPAPIRAVPIRALPRRDDHKERRISERGRLPPYNSEDPMEYHQARIAIAREHFGLDVRNPDDQAILHSGEADGRKIADDSDRRARQIWLDESLALDPADPVDRIIAREIGDESDDEDHLYHLDGEVGDTAAIVGDAANGILMDLIGEAITDYSAMKKVQRNPDNSRAETPAHIDTSIPEAHSPPPAPSERSKSREAAAAAAAPAPAQANGNPRAISETPAPGAGEIEDDLDPELREAASPAPLQARARPESPRNQRVVVATPAPGAGEIEDDLDPELREAASPPPVQTNESSRIQMLRADTPAPGAGAPEAVGLKPATLTPSPGNGFAKPKPTTLTPSPGSGFGKPKAAEKKG